MLYAGLSRPKALPTLSDVTRDLQTLLQPNGDLMPMPLAERTCPLVTLEARDLLLRFINAALSAYSNGWKTPEQQKLLRVVMVCLA